MAHDMSEPLTHAVPDSSGMRGTTLEQHIGKHFLHDGNGKTYAIAGLAWDSPTDLWALVYREVGCNAAMVTRDHVTFFGNRAGRPRFYHKQP